MHPLPETRPKWYQVDEEKGKGWTPQTSDISYQAENREITGAWSGTYYPPSPQNYTVKINGLKVLSPIQVGGGSFPEGGTLPAQVNGVPCIPGSSIRGAFLSWLRHNLTQFSEGEQQFWSQLMSADGKSWQPRKIRFETILLKGLKPYPLNPQQSWQVFETNNNKLGIQWQVSPQHPPRPGADTFDLHIIIKPTPSDEQKEWVQKRVNEFLEQRGIGRGSASGFGRLARRVPDGKWEITLTGMKPCVQPHIPNQNQEGQYRWSPQVLRANLRSYFTRLALAWLSPDQAEQLTNEIFGGLGCPARLVLTSYLRPIGRNINHNQANQQGYTNIPAREAHAEWHISVDCNNELQGLVGDLLELSSRLGGLGPGWRRPPHQMNRRVFRGSQFSYTPNPDPISHCKLIQRLYERVKSLAQEFNYNLFENPQQVTGGLNSIWEGNPHQWRDIVHGICSSNRDNRPDWCGDSRNRPSGYAVRQHEGNCLVTVFDPAVEATLQAEEFCCVWRVVA